MPIQEENKSSLDLEVEDVQGTVITVEKTYLLKVTELELFAIHSSLGCVGFRENPALDMLTYMYNDITKNPFISANEKSFILLDSIISERKKAESIAVRTL